MIFPHTSDAPATLTVIPPEAQGRGAFDGGRITEYKPIAFPHESGRQKRIGPLFYWAWASAEGYGKIGLHPHQGFEIISYVLAGELGHYDTLGNRSRVGPGGAQVMQTGSGVSHEEETVGEHTEFFQIWFEPYLREALLRPPTYAAVAHEEFPAYVSGGASVKTILGQHSPVTLVADARMHDVTLAPRARGERPLAAGRSLAVVTISGGGTIRTDDGAEADVRKGDFAVIHAHEAAVIKGTAHDEPWRWVVIEAPTTVDYPLYPRR